MAIYIKFHNDSRPHYQRNLPFSDEFIKDLNKMGRENLVDYIQADGDELEFILSRIKNIPHCYSICIWYGETARFIAANFPFM